jgi:hypothetical protein
MLLLVLLVSVATLQPAMAFDVEMSKVSAEIDQSSGQQVALVDYARPAMAGGMQLYFSPGAVPPASKDTPLKTDDSWSTAGNTTAAARLDGIRNLYNNDGENLLTVNSSYHVSMAPITDSVVRGSVRDTRGAVDANLIIPFHGVPWWNSSIEPPTAHRDWYDKTFGFAYDPNGGSQLDYIMRGGDLVGTFADEAIKEGQKPLISISMNDAQMCNCPPRPNGYKSMAANDHTFSYVSRTFYEHRFDKEAMLGYGEEPPTPWRPCCWELGNLSCANSFGCNEKACEFSWLSPVMPQRLVRLIGELSTMYGGKIAGIELCVRCAGDYFPLKTAQAVRRKVMTAFVRQVRLAMDAAMEGLGLPQLALGLQLSPDWGNLRAVGLDDLATVVAPTVAGGAGVTYLNWAAASRSVYPFDCDLASLAAATPPGTPWFFNIQSWTANGPGTPLPGYPYGCDVKIRVTKEELWTTALVARAYGARGLAAFNFIYTRYYSDGGCELAAGVPYSEPLFAAYGQTRNDTFISTADQYYRLSSNLNPVPGQLGHNGAALYPSKNDFGLKLVVFMVPPAGGWRQQGRLRLRTKLPLGSSAERLYVAINGHSLTSSANASSIFPTGVQAVLARYADELWHAWELPVACLRPGNNSVQIALRNTGTDAAIAHLDIGLPVTTRAPATARLKLDEDSVNIPTPPLCAAKHGVVFVDECGDGLKATDSAGQPDHTAVVQAALNTSGAHTVVLRNLSASTPWVVTPLFIFRDDVTFQFEPNAFLHAKRGRACRAAGANTCFHGTGDSMIKVLGKRNVSIIGGPGSTIRMWKIDYLNFTEYMKAEWRMGIYLGHELNNESAFAACQDMVVKGLSIEQSGGVRLLQLWILLPAAYLLARCRMVFTSIIASGCISRASTPTGTVARVFPLSGQNTC